MCIFQSEQAIKLQLRHKNTLAEKMNGHRIRQISFHWIVICGRDAVRNTRQKPTNIVKIKTSLLLVSIWNDLPHQFIDKAILSFRKRLRSCVAAAGGHFEHSA